MALGLLAALPVLPACNEDKQKAVTEESKKPQPVPSDMVFNDFVPASGSASLGVKDAGADGALNGVGGGAAGEPAAAGGEPAADKLKVVEQGAEPRAARKYAFAANRVDKRTVTFVQSVTQSMGGQTTPPQELTLKSALDFTPKQVKAAGTQWEAKVTKVEMPGAPPQIAQALGQMSGLVGTFEMGPRGEAGEVSFAGDPRMKNPLAENVLQGLSQTIELLVPPLPDSAVGVGAKWERNVAKQEPGGPPEVSKQTFVLKEATAEGGVVESEIEQKVPRHAMQARGQTLFVEREVKGKYTYTFRFDRIATKVEGDLAIAQKIEVTDPKQGKQIITETQKAKHLIESGGSAAPVSSAGK